VRLTVLMPVYNGARYLDESIESVLAQEPDDFELVVVDDGSADATPELLARWAARDARIVVVRQERNGGTSRALNAGLAAARGEYLARQDADDISLPGRFAKQAAALDAHAEAVWVTVGRLWIDERGKTLGTAPYLVASPEVTRFLLHFTPSAIGVPGQTMFRTAAARAIGGWDETYRVAQGWEFVSRLSKQGSLLALPELGMKYRVHPQRVSEQFKREQLENAIRITRRMLSELLGREVTVDEAAASASVWFLQSASGAAPVAARLLREASSRFPLSRQGRAVVRRIAAGRFIRTAAFHAARVRPLEVMQHLFEAIRL
jgi:glycosyltransferase involved in cell wall biosynthesis